MFFGNNDRCPFEVAVSTNVICEAPSLCLFLFGYGVCRQKNKSPRHPPFVTFFFYQKKEEKGSFLRIFIFMMLCLRFFYGVFFFKFNHKSFFISLHFLKLSKIDRGEGLFFFDRGKSVYEKFFFFLRGRKIVGLHSDKIHDMFS